MNKAQRDILRKKRVLEHAVQIRQHAEGLPLLRRLEVAFYGRGCQEKQSPIDRPVRHRCRGSQPLSPLRGSVDPASKYRSLLTAWCSLEKLKNLMGPWWPATVLCEPRRLWLF